MSTDASCACCRCHSFPKLITWDEQVATTKHPIQCLNDDELEFMTETMASTTSAQSSPQNTIQDRKRNAKKWNKTAETSTFAHATMFGIRHSGRRTDSLLALVLMVYEWIKLISFNGCSFWVTSWRFTNGTDVPCGDVDAAVGFTTALH